MFEANIQGFARRVICKFVDFSFYTGKSNQLDEGLAMCFYKVRPLESFHRRTGVMRGSTAQDDQITPYFFFFIDSVRAEQGRTGTVV